ncbi:3-oxoacyl-ACP reductase [Phyllobacterium phragmitis]|uniref:3-oxoacyl-ACP reductase n=1 Tax=Phyllobacterium phragmitis TaxID=2670329 RepID=A0A2S9IRP9_9HYPH|nr:SDR family oxidoreductase [Phyllobacterium phragmitis]PRD43201.1 3-oxoacyl-ACP reductase [Phyllobacterium phragmitis]
MTDTKRIAIVTGGSRGLGRSTVLSLAQRGVHSIFTYNSAADDADKVVAAVGEAGAKAVALQLDTGEVGSFDAFIGRVREALTTLGADRFDYLVNNAGMSDHTKFTELTEDVLDRVYAVNFKGVVFLTQKLLPLINDGGRIVNISTGLTRFTTPDTIPYASLKGAIEVFTHYMAKELGPRGITVNAVAPGAIQTDFSGGVVRDNAAVNAQVASMTALGRPGLPDDIGLLVAALLSENTRWVTGQRIEASGGMNL